MSFSFIIKEEDIDSTLSSAVDAKVDEIRFPLAKKEAKILSKAIPNLISTLAGNKEFESVSVLASSSEQSAQVSVLVHFKPPTTPGA